MVLVVCGVLLFSFAKKAVSKKSAALTRLDSAAGAGGGGGGGADGNSDDAGGGGGGGGGSGVDEGDGLRISNLAAYAELLRGQSPMTWHVVPKARSVSGARM
jgi:hypothetical protein